jgi:hypothetical protein
MTVGYETDGFEVVESRHLAFVGNVINNVGEGIDLGICRSCVVSGNVIDNAYNFGVKLVHGTQVSTVKTGY